MNSETQDSNPITASKAVNTAARLLAKAESHPTTTPAAEHLLRQADMWLAMSNLLHQQTR